MTLRLESLPTEEYAGWREAANRRRAEQRSIPMAGGDEAAGLAESWSFTDRVFPADGPADRNEVLAVLGEDDARVGVVALTWENDEDAFVFDLDLTDASATREVRALVEARVRDGGGQALSVRVPPGQEAATAFIAAGGFEVMATNMLLDLEGADSPGRAAVEVRPMTSAELDDYMAHGIEGFAEELMASAPGLTREHALEQSRQTHEQILPQGADTPGHSFLIALDADTGSGVGRTWLFVDGPKGFVYDIEVDADRRGQGLGRALMVAAADLCRDHGARVLGLNVFGHNAPARGLYESLGYDVVDEAWRERLSAG